MNAVVPIRTSKKMVGQLISQFKLPEPYLDVTFGLGRFWSDQSSIIGLDAYSPSPPIRASWEALPIKDQSIGTIFYDPPHLPMTGPNSAWRKRGYGHADWDYRTGFNPAPHQAFFAEASRVVRHDGYAVVKTADMIQWNKPYWLTLTVINTAQQEGWVLFDWLIGYRPAPLIDTTRVAENWHAKKHHAHWLIFVPPNAKVSRHARPSVLP